MRKGLVSWMTWKDAYSGMSTDNIKGLILALSSSLFIGSSFIIKKKGLKKAGASGIRAGTTILNPFLIHHVFVS